MNAKINMMYQIFLPLNVYLESANPVVADTAVCANASNVEKKMDPISEAGISNCEIAFTKFSPVGCFAIHVIVGSIKSAVVIIDFDIISKIGFKYTYPIQMRIKYIAILAMMLTIFNFLNLAKLNSFILDKLIDFALIFLFAIQPRLLLLMSLLSGKSSLLLFVQLLEFSLLSLSCLDIFWFSILK